MLDHLGDLMLGAEKRAGEIDGDGIVPAGFGNAGRGTAFAERAGIVERDIQPAEGLDGQRDKGLGIVLGAHVAGECHRAAAVGLDLGDEAREFGFAPCADDHLGAFGCEQLGGGPADAGACAGDDGDLVLKTS